VLAELGLLIGLAVLLALIIKTFFVQAFYIPSASMEETLRVNDRILVQKWSYWFGGEVERGDIVVFSDPAHWLAEEDGAHATNFVTKTLSAIGLYPSGGFLVKRVIGVGGDVVACRRNLLTVNGQPLDEKSYITLTDRMCTRFTVTVPEDHLWVMGDNRANSADSRAHAEDTGRGFIPQEDVVGKVFVVVWPLGRWQFMHKPGTFENEALDQAAGVVSATAPVGLALMAAPLLIRRIGARSQRKVSS
jgi:signal peptidase I